MASSYGVAEVYAVLRRMTCKKWPFEKAELSLQMTDAIYFPGMLLVTNK
jgi:hypothetical protein